MRLSVNVHAHKPYMFMRNIPKADAVTTSALKV